MDILILIVTHLLVWTSKCKQYDHSVGVLNPPNHIPDTSSCKEPWLYHNVPTNTTDTWPNRTHNIESINISSLWPYAKSNKIESIQNKNKGPILIGNFTIQMMTPDSPLSKNNSNYIGSSNPYINIKFRGSNLNSEIWGHAFTPTFSYNVLSNDTAKFSFSLYNQDKKKIENLPSMHSVYVGQINLTVQSLINRHTSTPLELWVN